VFYMVHTHRGGGEHKLPIDEELQLEASRIILGSEVLSKQGISSTPSWLRDLLLSSDQLTMQAKMAPIRSSSDSQHAKLKINGKDNIFEDDPLELELHEYVKARRLLGLTAMDSELQVEACNIIGRMEESSSHPSEEFANFLLRLIYSSTKWLASFRQRAVLPRSEDMEDEAKRSRDPNTVDSTIHNYSRLESELAEYVRTQRSMGIEPSDTDLQRQARMIIYEFDDEWNQTAADNVAWLNAFKQRHVSSEVSAATLANSAPLTIASVTHAPPSVSGQDDAFLTCYGTRGTGHLNAPNENSMSESTIRVGARFFNDGNCYRRLARELGRYVGSAMSPLNPNFHIPSDEELQHQARWILYDE
jgi:Tc5 transposase DNA-binding domain